MSHVKCNVTHALPLFSGGTRGDCARAADRIIAFLCKCVAMHVLEGGGAGRLWLMLLLEDDDADEDDDALFLSQKSRAS